MVYFLFPVVYPASREIPVILNKYLLSELWSKVDSVLVFSKATTTE